MVIINKDREISILVFAFFVFAFLVFLFMKPSFTGMVTSSVTSSDTQLNPGESLVGKVTLSLKTADKIPSGSQARLYIIDSTNGVFDSSNTMLLQDFVLNTAFPWTTQAGVDFDNSETVAPNEYDWEAGNGEVFTVASDSNLEVDISDFGGLSFPSNPGTYTVVFNLTYQTYAGTIQNSSLSFTVNALPSDVKRPGITNVVFVNENGSRNFMKAQYVNCSAFVKDEDSISSVSVNYIIWGNSSRVGITNPGATGPMVCADSDAGVTIPWSTGRTCSVKDKVSTSDLGYWNCTIIAYDGTNYNYSNATIPLLMVNSPPKLKKAIENLTWNKNENNTELDLDDYFDDPDEQSINYSVSSTSHINITISSTADVTLMPQLDWLGNENVTFKARDEKGAETESNTVRLIVTTLLNCTSNWTCGNWSDCTGGIQTRVCTDLKSCSVPIGKPLTLQNCTGLTITCADDGYCKAGCSGGDPDCSCTNQGGYICGANLNCSSILLSYDSGVCCSVPCSSSTNTIGKSGTSGFLGSQTDRILIGVGTIAAVVFIVTLIIILSSYMDKRKAVITEEKPVQTIEQTPQQKSLDVTPVKIKPTNIEKMKDYIEQSLANKVPMRIIKTELNKVGWTESDIDNELNIARLRNYIQIKLNQGIPRAQIEQSLRMKGWSQFQIDEASRNTKVRPLI